jgi:hypothetical protein
MQNKTTAWYTLGEAEKATSIQRTRLDHACRVGRLARGGLSRCERDHEAAAATLARRRAARPKSPVLFCQFEAIETLIWLTEASASERVGIEIPGDGGPFPRLRSKMATGSGKTILMAMRIAWQALKKVTYQQDKRFSKNFLLIAPGLTVKSRLRILVPRTPGNFYSELQIISPGLEDKLRQSQTCRMLVHNWHKLDKETVEQIRKKRSVDKRGAKSDEAYVRDVLGEMASAQNIVIINDEAHPAWRVPPKSRIAGVSKYDVKMAAHWIEGLDRMHRARGILTCFDLTATPFAPTGKKSGEETLFNWIISDFGLNNAIESGLVKTPRVVVRDDGVSIKRSPVCSRSPCRTEARRPRSDRVLPPPMRRKQRECISSSLPSLPRTCRRVFRTSTASTKWKSTSPKSASAQQSSRRLPSWRTSISLRSSWQKGFTPCRSRRRGRFRKSPSRTSVRSPFASLRTPGASRASDTTSRATS